MVYGEMHYHGKNYFKGKVSESVQNQVHAIDYSHVQVFILYLQVFTYSCGALCLITQWPGPFCNTPLVGCPLSSKLRDEPSTFHQS